MDRNDYYGGDSASLNLTQVRTETPSIGLSHRSTLAPPGHPHLS